MALEQDLFTALKSLVGNRVAANIFPQPPAVPTWPAILYTIVDSVPVVDICGDGDDTTSTPRVQLDLVTTEFKATRALRLQVMAVMKTFNPPAILELDLNNYDADTKTHRATLDYTIHGSTLSGSPP